MQMNDILTYLLMAGIAFAVGFFTAWGIVEAWVLFWEWGWIYNEVTVPPMVIWHILLTNIVTILILAGIIAIVIFVLLCFYVAYS